MMPSFMSPDRMRLIDYWIGVPACWTLTVARRARAALRGRRPMPLDPPRRVLFVELAEMGTTVLAYPAIQRVKERSPGADVFFLIFKHIAEGVRTLEVIPEAHVITIDASSLWTLARDTWRFMRLARRHRIDTAINLETFVRLSTILCVLSGARRRVGFHAFTQEGLYCGRLLTHEVIYNPHLHMSQSLVTLVDALDEPLDHVPLGKFVAPSPSACAVPRRSTGDAGRTRVQQLVGAASAAAGRRLIVINPNASALLPLRKWPLDRYARLVERLLHDPRNVCVVTGSASEREEARFILERVKSDRVVDLTGKTSLADLIDLFNVADVLVSNDSGPAQFAALTDIHAFVFFGPETPARYGPLSDRCVPLYASYACSPCVTAFNQRRSPCHDNLCVQHFDVETVAQLVTSRLDAPIDGHHSFGPF
jgi:ADP-heptose:LPS heptosyltransferase